MSNRPSAKVQSLQSASPPPDTFSFLRGYYEIRSQIFRDAPFRENKRRRHPRQRGTGGVLFHFCALPAAAISDEPYRDHPQRQNRPSEPTVRDTRRGHAEVRFRSRSKN